jgi:hypothetical protein
MQGFSSAVRRAKAVVDSVITADLILIGAAIAFEPIPLSGDNLVRWGQACRGRAG